VNPVFVAIPAFLAITLVVVAVYLVFRDLVFGGTAQGTAAGGPVRLRQMPLARDHRPAQGVVGGFDQWFNDLVTQSGLAWTPITALLLLLLVGTFVGGFAFLWAEAPLPAILGMFGGMVLVLVWLSFIRARRIRLLQEQLPDALEMLARAVHAGESVEQAVQLVGEKGPEPLAVEFRRCANQLGLGLSLAAVMRALVYRVRLLDMRIFTATLKVHRQAGGNLVLTLERMAAVIRDRLTTRRQNTAATAASRMSALFLFFLGPMIFLYLFFGQREYFNTLLESPLGQTMLIIAAFLEVVGLVWIARMLRYQY